MGVYNPKMKIPDSCWACPFCTEECFGSYKCFDVKDWGSEEERAKDCPLADVKTPHGDLIERDALLRGEGRYIIALGKEGIDVEEIKRAPTIIEAEDNDED